MINKLFVLIPILFFSSFSYSHPQIEVTEDPYTTNETLCLGHEEIYKRLIVTSNVTQSSAHVC